MKNAPNLWSKQTFMQHANLVDPRAEHVIDLISDSVGLRNVTCNIYTTMRVGESEFKYV